MIENPELQAKLDEFAKHFPKIDFSNVTSGYNQVENILVKHIKEFGPDQWKAIVNSKYNDLFQDGSPHFSWNTDRHAIVWELVEDQKPCRTWRETWYDCRLYSVQMGETLLEIKIEEPRTMSGRTHYYLRIAEEFIPVPTHRAVVIGIGSDTRAYISDQFAGTENECENWVAENVKGRFFKIMKIE